jgi:hypothetical protein
MNTTDFRAGSTASGALGGGSGSGGRGGGRGGGRNIGQANTVKHAVYLCQFMHALRLPVELPIPIYADNQSAKTVAEVN